MVKKHNNTNDIKYSPNYMNQQLSE